MGYLYIYFLGPNRDGKRTRTRFGDVANRTACHHNHLGRINDTAADHVYLQEAQLSPRDRAMRRVNRNLANSNQIKSNMTLIMVDKPQPSYNLLNVMK